ncbi:hypothetical protein GT370_05065 [Acidocella sp. MX-AZ03]|uniref:hypothetical protein n=1 Tax=Acidocella sp. MX-AZ03 TaxID=2697363 RepID=UPI0022DD348C|nr:hypothetical protein [Acidocella sp. MX-AZ03]WBO60203.1 hypothetical protein GT370_05065 [Acidocella sp. MX-AZ03]
MVLLAGMVLALLVLAAGVFYLNHTMTRSQKLGKRIDLAIHGRNAALLEEAKPEGSALVRLVSAFGMSVARSGLLSRKTLAEMTATLEGRGFAAAAALACSSAPRCWVCSCCRCCSISPSIIFSSPPSGWC